MESKKRGKYAPLKLISNLNNMNNKKNKKNKDIVKSGDTNYKFIKSSFVSTEEFKMFEKLYKNDIKRLD